MSDVVLPQTPLTIGARQRRIFESTNRNLLYYRVDPVFVDIAANVPEIVLEISGATFLAIHSVTAGGIVAPQQILMKIGEQNNWLSILPGDKFRFSPVERVKFKKGGGAGSRTVFVLHSNDPNFDWWPMGEAGLPSTDRGSWAV